MTNDAPVLSIVIVNWNTRDLLLSLLDRLFAGPRLPMEVVVVDNQSADDSVAAARRAFPKARILPQPVNGGFAYGANRGMRIARGRWILLLNTDAEANQEAIAAFVAAAERHPGAAVFGPRIVDENGNVQRSAWQRHLPWHYLPNALFLGRLVEPAQPATEADVDVVSGCVFLLRSSLLREIGGFDERFFMYFEEADLCERTRRAGHAVRYLPVADFVHAGGLSAEQSKERTFVAFRESTLLYHVAWHGRARTEWIRACLLLGHLLRLGIWSVLGLFGRKGKAPLYRAALRRLVRLGYVGELARRPREVPDFT